jgi:hypothetical protein
MAGAVATTVRLTFANLIELLAALALHHERHVTTCVACGASRAPCIAWYVGSAGEDIYFYAESRHRTACLRIHATACPKQQAGVAIGIEPVAAVDGVRVGAPHHVETAEGRDQHEQGRARQVEIGQHRVHGAKTVARRDEQRRLARIGRERAVRGGGAFDQPQRG